MRQVIVFSPVESTFERDDERSNAEFDMFWKEIFPEGTWKHPNKGFVVKADKARMEKWANNFTRQKELNIQVPVPYGHTYSADKNAGFVEELEVRKKENGKYSTYALMGIPLGDDSKKINKTIKGVSIALSPSVKHSSSDGKVVDLGECLEHVALTNYPVISGMQDFVAFDQEGDAIATACLDMISDEVKEEDPEGYALSEEQIKEYAKGVAQNTIDAYVVKQQLESKGEEKMGVTPEQLRAIELKFDIEDGSLTEENWFDKVNEVKLEEKKELIEPEKFDITKDEQFQKLLSENQSLLLDRNQRRLVSVQSRLKGTLDSGRINKTVFDKIVPKEEQLQFSQESCVGDEWDSWISGIEAQLSIIEELPEGCTVPTKRSTAPHTSNFFDQEEDNSEESKAMDKQIDDDIKDAVPQYHQDNVKLDPKTGVFSSVE